MSYTLNEIEKDHYRFGACHLFALALHLEYGYSMHFFWEKLPDMDLLDAENPNCLIHAYACSPDGRMFDVDGETTVFQIAQTYSPIDPSRVRIETAESVRKLMDAGILWHEDEEGIKALQEAIRADARRYQR